MVEPLSLKARAGVGGGAAGSIQCEISRAWAVKKTQRGLYTGGKVRPRQGRAPQQAGRHAYSLLPSISM